MSTEGDRVQIAVTRFRAFEPRLTLNANANEESIFRRALKIMGTAERAEHRPHGTRVWGVSHRIARGGGWNAYAGITNATHRSRFPPSRVRNLYGFRVVLDLTPEELSAAGD